MERGGAPGDVTVVQKAAGRLRSGTWVASVLRLWKDTMTEAALIKETQFWHSESWCEVL